LPSLSHISLQLGLQLMLRSELLVQVLTELRRAVAAGALLPLSLPVLGDRVVGSVVFGRLLRVEAT